MTKIHIQSERLQLAEPFMQQYYDYHPSMLTDEIWNCVANSGINPCKKINGISTICYDDIFMEHKELIFVVQAPFKQRIDEQFGKYFSLQDEGEEEVITEDDRVLFSLTYMSYIYHKTKAGLFNDSCIVRDLDLEYQHILHNKIYPEMLSLYRMILQSKNKKNRGANVTISYKQDKIDINTAAWFLDDMERYFKDRFPDLTLEDIDRLLPRKKEKAGRKFTDRTISNLIWGTYQLLYNHHSAFKNSKVKISNEIGQFILDYLDYLTVPNDYTIIDIRDHLKDMIKRNYTPQWELPWHNVFSNIHEKQPEDEFEKLDQPPRRYIIDN